MKTLEEITDIENQYCGQTGNPSLGQAFTQLNERWHSDEKDKETALRLLFLVWYSCSEPNYLTGLPDLDNAPELFSELFESLGGKNTNDPEVCFVTSLMAELFPYCIGDEKTWLSTSRELKERCSKLQPKGFAPSYFKGRGAYGEYFAHMVSNHDKSS